SEGNPVDIARTVLKQLPEIRAGLPQGTDLVIINDDSRFIKSSVEDTLSNVFLGILFTGLVLLFFLHDLRSTLIVAVAMPTSIISTFLALQLADFSINILTLMGLSTSVGILVTNSVVVLENIFRHKEFGHGRRESANIGTTEIAVAVIASTLTNIVVFVPLAMMQTIAGQFLKEFALTVAFATIFSLLISFTITPMLASLILPETKKKHPWGDKLERMFRNWEKTYRDTLEKVIHDRKSSVFMVAAAIMLFLVVMILFAPRLGFEFLPDMDEGNISIYYELPEGYNLQETAAVYEEIEVRLSRFKEISHLLVRLGTQGWTDEAPNLAVINIKLVDANRRKYSSDEMTNFFIQELSTLPNAKFKVSVGSSMGGGGGDIEFYLMGQDIDELNRLTQQIIEKGKKVPGLINFDSNSRPGKPEISLIPRREQLASAGISVYELAMTLRASLEGLIATQYRERGNEYDIRVSLTGGSVDTPEEVKNIPVITPVGAYRMSQLADVEYTSGSTKIVHRDKYKSIQFSGDIALGYVQSQIMNDLQIIQDAMVLPPGYKFQWAGNSEMMQENNREMGKAFLIAILLTYMLLAAILESFTKPVLILLTLPLAMIGVILALYISGKPFGMISMMGVIMLLGIVVNAAILLLDYTQQLREKGMNTRKALLEACPTKLKPIIMSSIAIIMGMLPMALGLGTSGSEIRQPLGIVSIGGLVVSTFLTLYVIPALYFLTTREKVKQIKKV
ncbi:MAG: efflux RND transporter permease subunit, partial [Candidatus Cloacimonetes bacterium]|nr:efflux RND transporter permease subunit [Candidatus Cloacimonadota bacterium]